MLSTAFRSVSIMRSVSPYDTRWVLAFRSVPCVQCCVFSDCAFTIQYSSWQYGFFYFVFVYRNIAEKSAKPAVFMKSVKVD